MSAGAPGGDYAEKARGYFDRGCSCAQSVFAAFHAEMGLPEETALKLASSMGGGVAGMREVCGAFTGLCLAIGALEGFTFPENRDEKERHYAVIRQKAERLQGEYGSLICRNLLEGSLDHGVCPRLVEACARLTAEELKR